MNDRIKKIKLFFTRLYPQKDKLWLLFWLSGIILLWIWNLLFLNKPALRKVESSFFNTTLIALLVIGFTLILSWSVTFLAETLKNFKRRGFYLALIFLLNLIRSVPQIVGILAGYIIITYLMQAGILSSPLLIFILMAFVMSLFMFPELMDLMRERIDHYKKLEFYNAMIVCGISQTRIINYDILWKNSRIHIFNKLIAIFGMAVFLQCSVDFIISVGLSTDVSAVNLPDTLGSLLARIDSKQDILAIGHAITSPGYIPKIFFEHLQGVTVAFVIVFTLLSVYKIANGFAERYRL